MRLLVGTLLVSLVILGFPSAVGAGPVPDAARLVEDAACEVAPCVGVPEGPLFPVIVLVGWALEVAGDAAEDPPESVVREADALVGDVLPACGPCPQEAVFALVDEARASAFAAIVLANQAAGEARNAVADALLP